MLNEAANRKMTICIKHICTHPPRYFIPINSWSKIRTGLLFFPPSLSVIGCIWVCVVVVMRMSLCLVKNFSGREHVCDSFPLSPSLLSFSVVRRQIFSTEAAPTLCPSQALLPPPHHPLRAVIAGLSWMSSFLNHKRRWTRWICCVLVINLCRRLVLFQTLVLWK